MRHNLPIRARIADKYVANGINWLEIHDRDGGYYLFHFTDITLPPKWDTFTDNLEDLMLDCRKIWNIEDDQWAHISSITNVGEKETK